MIGTSRLLARDRARGFAVMLTAMLVMGVAGGWVSGPSASIAVAQEDAVPLADLPISLGGSRVSVPEATGKIREYELVAAPTRWEVLPGVGAEAYAYNSQVPGPTIRVTEGDTLRVMLRNELNEPTSIHWHGLHVPNAMDGVPPLTQEAVEPGGSFLYEFVVSHAGTFMYHSHVDAAEQIDRGLYGPLIVDPQPANAGEAAFNEEFTMMLSAWKIPQPEGGADAAMAGMEDASSSEETTEASGNLSMQMDYNYFTINGKAFPAVPAWEVDEGDLVRVRMINISNLAHPMHLHGQDFKVVAKDGEPLRPEQQLVMNTLSVDAGETYDVVFVAESPGTWVFHCHELHHTENDGVEPGGLMQAIETKAAGDN
jgi:manganese oxidase